MTNPTTQRRLMALLVGAIYRIVNGLFPVIDTIVKQSARPYPERVGLAARFSRIIQQLLALTARIRPETLARNPVFPKPRQPTTRSATDALPRQPGPARPTRMLSALQLALRLATLLRQLEILAAEIRATLPPGILHAVARARTLAGCDALPTKSWERAG